MGFVYGEVEHNPDYDYSSESITLESKDIRLKLNYMEHVDCHYILMTISKLKDSDFFSFDEYLTYKKKDNKALYGSLDMSAEQYIEFYFKLFQKAVDDDLHDVLVGKIWPNIPRDWSVAGR